MQTVKRLSDLLIVSISLIILSPWLFVLAILVRIFLRNPIIFRQQRPGRHGKPFTIYRFRTMTGARDAQDNLLPDAERLTPFGRFLHSPSLDERMLTWKLMTWPMKSSCPPKHWTTWLHSQPDSGGLC